MSKKPDALAYAEILERLPTPLMVAELRRLHALNLELVGQLQDVLERIEVSDEWWIDCPDRGGFDAKAIRAAIAKTKEQQS